MDSLLTAVKTSNTGNRREDDHLSEAVSQKNPRRLPQGKPAIIEKQCVINTPQEAQRCLSTGPTDSQFLQVLKFLDPMNAAQTGYDITDPEPFTISVLNNLVALAINDRWANIENEHRSCPKSIRTRSSKAIVLRCLTSISGIGALITNLRTNLDKATSQQGEESSGRQLLLRDTLSALSRVLQTPLLLLEIYQRISRITSPAKKRLAWSQLIAFLASGRALSTAGESLRFMKDGDIPTSIRWLGEGKIYASWLGRCIVSMTTGLEEDDLEGWSHLAKFTQRSLSLGYTSEILNEIYPTLLLQLNPHVKPFGKLVGLLEAQFQKRVFESILHDLEEKYLPESMGISAIPPEKAESNNAIWGVSAVVASILDALPFLSQHLTDNLAKGIGGGIRGFNMRRALIAIFENQEEVLAGILNKAIVLFGDELYIKHTPQMAQEANTQVILLIAGYLHRYNATALVNITKSGPYLSAITHRIGASLPRSRFLGMVVGMGLSKLNDSPEKALKFQTDEMQSQDAFWYMSLTGVRDQVGSLNDLPNLKDAQSRKLQAAEANKSHQGSRRPGPKSSSITNQAKIISIEEVFDESEEEDLYGYEKPDTDASDSEEDPTLIERSKPSAPVYIRDLISALRDTENPERYNQAISTAPELIRRKAAFGTEILENANDLALQLISLQDKYDMPKFHERRLESLVALIVALTSEMGRWMAHSLFNIDLSLSHRSTILVALGLSARELAGYGDEDAKAMGLSASSSKQSFPSKRVPEHLEAAYGSSGRSIESISQRISQNILEPLALTAADTLTGPDVMKLQPLSSRAKDMRQRQEREIKRKQKSMPKGMYETLSKGFLLPLLGEFGVMMYTMRSFGNSNPFLEPHLISLFVQTITLLVSTIGPHSPSLNLSTSDVFSLLTTLHNLPIASDPIVLPAILSLFLTIVDVNVASGSTAEESLVTQFATSTLELREWVDGVFERASKEDERLRALAAGIMVKLEEVTKRYQGRLLGLNSKFEY